MKILQRLVRPVQAVIDRCPWPVRRLAYMFSPLHIDWLLVRDLFLGRFPREFAVSLLRNHGLRRRTLRISLYTGSACQLHCEECIMQHSMADNPPYQLSLEFLREFLDVSQQSHYRFEIVLSGGEPLLWKNLKEGVRMMKSSPVCAELHMFTNALSIHALDDETVGFIDQIRISKYEGNEKNSEELCRRYGKKITIVDRREFWKNPVEPVEGSLPAYCMNDEIWLYDGEVYACPHSHSIALGRGVKPRLSQPLKKGFIEGLHRIKLEQQNDVCRNCISNNKVIAREMRVANKRDHQRFVKRK